MADLKITQLPVVTAVGDGDPLVAVVGGVTSQVTKANLLAGLGGGRATVSAAAPQNPSEGDQWWDTTGSPDAALKVRIGSSWVSAADPRVATWARAVSPSGTAPVARLGTGSATASVFLRGDGTWAVPPAGGGGGGLTTTQVDARVATWARAVLPFGIAPAARLGTGASGTRFLRADGTWQIITTLLSSSLPSMDKYAKGNVSTTSVTITLATLRAQCVETNRDNAYVPPDPITSNFTEPSGDFYIIRQRFLLSTLARWSNLRLMLDVRPDDTVLVFALLSDRFGRLTGDQLAVAGAAYSQTSAGATTVNDAITLSDWGSADSDSKWWVMLEVYCIEGSGGQQLDYTIGYTPDGGAAVTPATVNAVGGLATVNTPGEQPASLTLGTGLAVVGTVLTAPAGAAPANWALATSPTGTAPVARLGTGTPTTLKFLRGDGSWAAPTTIGGDTEPIPVSSWAYYHNPTGVVPIVRGGTNSGTAAGARTNLGLGNAAQYTVGTSQGHLAVLASGGRFQVTRLGSGVASTGVFLRGDGAWQVIPFNATQVDARIVTWARAVSPTGMVPLSRGGTSANSAVAARSSLGLGTAATHTVGTGSGHLAALGSNGRFALARLGSGSPASDRFLRGDGAWQVIPFNASGVDARIATWARASSPSGQVPIAYGGTGGGTAAAARHNLGLGSAALLIAGNSTGELTVLGPGGVFAPARLGSGTPSSSKFLRGDGAWSDVRAVPTGGTDHQNLTWENGTYGWRSPIAVATLKRVTKIPAAYDESLLYLTHDEIDNTTSAENADLVPGVNDRPGGDFFGWTRGHNGIPATGTLTPNYIPVETIGTSQGTFTGTGADRVVTGWGIEFIGSHNRDFGEAWPVIVIGGFLYNIGGRAWSNSYGLWLFAVINGPTGLTGTNTINFLSSTLNGLYLLSNGTAITRKAGLWVWNGTAYALLADPDSEEPFRAIAGHASGEGWGFTRESFRHKSWWLGSDLVHRLLGATIAPDDAGKTWAVTRADGAIRLRASQSEHQDLTGAEFDPAGVALAAATAPVSFFDSSVVQGWTDPNVMATPGLWAAHTRTSADGSSGSVTFIEGDKANAFTLGYRHVQRMPPSIISGSADGYLSRLNLSTLNGIYLYLGLTSSESGSTAGPNLTETARVSLGIAVRAADGTTGKWRISDLGNDSFSEPYRWTGASIPTALVTALKAAGAQVVLVDTSNANVNWDNLTFGGVSSETQGVGVKNALILQHRRLRVWRGADEVDIRVGTTPGASYQLPVLAESDRWIGPDADSDTLYALRAGAALHLARLPYRSIVQPAHSGASQQLRAVITAGPATGKLWDSDVSGAGSAAAGADLGLTHGLTIGSFDIVPEFHAASEIVGMEITAGANQELNLGTTPPFGSFTGDNQIAPGLSVAAVQVSTYTHTDGTPRAQLGLNRASGETVGFLGWHTAAGQGLGKSWYVVNPDGSYVEFANADAYSVGSSWLNIRTGLETTVGTFAEGARFTLICADAGGLTLTPYAAITLKRNGASTTAVTAWITHEATHSLYYVAPNGTITEMLLSADTPTAEQMSWLVSNGPARPAAGEVFTILIARKEGISAAEVPATIEAPSIIYYTFLPVPMGTGTNAQPDGVPVAMSVRNDRLSILYSQGGVARFHVGATSVVRVASEDVDLDQYIDPATPTTLIMSDSSLLHQASDFIRKWALILGGGGAGGGSGGATETEPGRVRQILFARAATKPDVPHYNYIGGADGYSPPVTSASVWQGSDPDESSVHPLWMATAESVEQEGGGWLTGGWTIVTIGSFAVRYAVHLTLNATQFEANWHGPPQIFGVDRWMQIRDDTGAWGAPLVVARGPYVDPFVPLVTGHYIGAYSQSQIMTIYGNGNLLGRKELLFQVRLFDVFAEPTTDPITTWKGDVQNIWAKLSTSLNFPIAPPLSNAAKDEYAFCITAHRREGLKIALNSATTNFYDIAGLQATIWVRFVQDVHAAPCCYDRIQIFGFDKLYSRGYLDISTR